MSDLEKFRAAVRAAVAEVAMRPDLPERASRGEIDDDEALCVFVHFLRRNPSFVRGLLAGLCKGGNDLPPESSRPLMN